MYKNISMLDIENELIQDINDNTTINSNIIILSERFYNDENGFGIYYCSNANISDENIEDNFSIKGIFLSSLIVGQTYKVKGIVSTYQKNEYKEKQIQIKEIHAIKPLNKQGIIKYLQSLKGLKSKAETIYALYGANSIDILMKDPLLISKTVKGIGKKTAESWSMQLEELKDTQHIMTKLLDYGLTIKQSKKLYNKFGDEIISLIEKNPYSLSENVKGYGFKSCDRIAKNMGYDLKSKFRIQEAIIYALKESSLEGHCYLPLNDLIDRTIEILNCRLTYQEMLDFSKENKSEKEYFINDSKFMINIEENKRLLNLYLKEKNPSEKEKNRYLVLGFEEYEVALQLEDLKINKRIIFDLKDEIQNIYLINLFYNELSVSYNTLRLSETTKFKKQINLLENLEKYLKSNNIVLEEKQKYAVELFAKEKGGFFILNGSAGCGKTFTLKIILELLKQQYSNNNLKCNIKIFAPTGKASKVATKATGLECVTIHRGLGYNPVEGFIYNKENKLDADILIIDETSMLDINLSKSLLEALKTGTKVIFIGDIQQLPSIGPGNVLKDLINSNVISMVTLDVIKRQNNKSGIIVNANKIIDKKMIANCDDTNDSFVMFRNDLKDIQDLVIRSIKRVQTVKNLGLDDIQVLCPQKNGVVGTNILNYLIQKEFNTDKNELVVRNKAFSININNKPIELVLNFKKGDKVINIENDYDMNWYEMGSFDNYIAKQITGITNGEVGVIHDIVKVKEGNNLFFRIIVKYDDGFVFYDDTFEQLEHAYALTIHKSQGSQWKAIIIPIVYQNFLMLNNNLLYTAFTRAQEFNVVIAQKGALDYCINNTDVIKRYTSLQEKLSD